MNLNNGSSEIKNFAILDKLDKDCKNANNEVTVEITKIISDPTYLAAEASKDGKK